MAFSLAFGTCLAALRITAPLVPLARRRADRAAARHPRRHRDLLRRPGAARGRGLPAAALVPRHRPDRVQLRRHRRDHPRRRRTRCRGPDRGGLRDRADPAARRCGSSCSPRPSGSCSRADQPARRLLKDTSLGFIMGTYQEFVRTANPLIQIIYRELRINHTIQIYLAGGDHLHPDQLLRSASSAGRGAAAVARQWPAVRRPPPRWKPQAGRGRGLTHRFSSSTGSMRSSAGSSKPSTWA